MQVIEAMYKTILSGNLGYYIKRIDFGVKQKTL